MKKPGYLRNLLMITAAAIMLSGCGGETGNTEPESGKGQNAPVGQTEGREEGKQAVSQSPGEPKGKQAAAEGEAGRKEQEAGSEPDLREVKSRPFPMAETEEGCYRIAMIQDENDNSACYLTYVDYASGQEVYLCGRPECSHISQDCTSLLTESMAWNATLFLSGDNLYLLSTPPDQEGATATGGMIDAGGDGAASAPPQEDPPSLWRMNPDGSERTPVYRFPSGVVLEESPGVAIRGNQLFLITKKLQEQQTSGQQTYTAALDKKLTVFDLDRSEVVKEFPITQESVRAAAWFGHYLLLAGYTEGGPESICRMDVETGETAVVKEFEAGGAAYNYEIVGTNMYYGVKGSGTIQKLDLETLKEETAVQTQDNMLIATGDGKTLRCHDWTKECGYKADFNLETGSLKEPSGLLIQGMEGLPLDIKAETSDSFLVCYEMTEKEEYVAWADTSQVVIDSQKWGLITKEDYFAGNPVYREMTMLVY